MTRKFTENEKALIVEGLVRLRQDSDAAYGTLVPYSDTPHTRRLLKRVQDINSLVFRLMEWDRGL